MSLSYNLVTELAYFFLSKQSFGNVFVYILSSESKSQYQIKNKIKLDNYYSSKYCLFAFKTNKQIKKKNMFETKLLQEYWRELNSTTNILTKDYKLLK